MPSCILNKIIFSNGINLIIAFSLVISMQACNKEAKKASPSVEVPIAKSTQDDKENNDDDEKPVHVLAAINQREILSNLLQAIPAG